MNDIPNHTDLPLGAKIARLVQERGWNQEEFARSADLNRLTVRSLFQGPPRKLHNATVSACARALGLSEVTAFCWSMMIIGYWIWMLVLLVLPIGRAYGLGLLVVSMIGFSLRRGSGLKWMLVILTFEGAVRVGLLLSLCGMVWRRI